MSVGMEEAVSQMELAVLADLSIHELQRYRRKEPFDDRYCVEVVRRALVEQTDDAWLALEQCFSETIRCWLHSHPNWDVALARDSEENYIAQTFSRFWYAVRDQHIEFSTLYVALSYLHATLNGIIIDTLRSHLRSCSREDPFPESGCRREPIAEDSQDFQSVWSSIQLLLSDERERRLAYLLFYCGLKPRDIVILCSQEFDDVKDVYRLNHNIVDRLRRSKDRLRYLLGDIE
ncbi:MAG: hypothetical protein M3Y76_09025 [Chloroflexota bacterium]|nr:hypothetical protein [Chloroflexota bacterium]